MPKCYINLSANSAGLDQSELGLHCYLSHTAFTNSQFTLPSQILLQILYSHCPYKYFTHIALKILYSHCPYKYFIHIAHTNTLFTLP